MDETQELATTQPGLGADDLASGPTLSMTQTGHTLAMPPAPRAALGAGVSQPPECIGRYLVDGHLGEGGMGVVYRAHDADLDRRVAVKLLRASLTQAQGHARARERMMREARAMARLEHPNVVRVYEVGSADEHLFVAMEYIEGHTLDEWLGAESRSWAEVAAVFAQAGEGLLAAHEVGIVHRDFKPHNVLIELDRGASQLVGVRARVLDFGLAGLGDRLGDSLADFEDELGPRNEGPETLAETAARLTMTGTLLGTPAYMAPEQFSGARVDHRADQFAYCIALYEALYGRRPFRGDTLEKLRLSVLAGDLERPPLGADVPNWLERLVLRGLAADPEERWPSMRELLVELNTRLGTAVADQLSRSAGSKTRSRVFGLAALGVSFFSIPAFFIYRINPDTGLAIIKVLGPLATLGMAAIVFLLRDTLLSTRYNRRASALILGVLLAALGNVVAVTVEGGTLVDADRSNLTMLAAVGLLAAASLERQMLFVVASSVLGFVLSLVWPIVAGMAFALSMIALCALIALGSNRRAHKGAGISVSLRGSALRGPARSGSADSVTP